MELWIPESAKRRVAYRCRLCDHPFFDGEMRAYTSHVRRCYASKEAEIRTSNPQLNPFLKHPEPDLEAFMQTHGGLNRKKGERRAAPTHIPRDT